MLLSVYPSRSECIMQIGVWVGILVSAIIAFVVGDYYGQQLHWYLFILMVIIGLFINTVILILKSKDEHTKRNEPNN